MIDKLIFFYLIIGLLFIFINIPIPQVYLGFLIFFTFKWVFNYRKCTISWLECKIRGVEKKNGYLNYCLDTIVDIRNTNNIYIIYIVSFGIILYELIYKKRIYDILHLSSPTETTL